MEGQPATVPASAYTADSSADLPSACWATLRVSHLSGLLGAVEDTGLDLALAHA